MSLLPAHFFLGLPFLVLLHSLHLLLFGLLQGSPAHMYEDWGWGGVAPARAPALSLAQENQEFTHRAAVSAGRMDE